MAIVNARISTRPSSASIKPRSFTVAARGGTWTSSNTTTFEWVDWFNHRRLLEPIGNVPPAEFEASYYHSTGQLPMAA